MSARCYGSQASLGGWRGILDGQHLGTALRAGESERLLLSWGVGSRRCGSRAPLELGGSGGESPVTAVSNSHPQLGWDAVTAGQAQWGCHQCSHSWGQSALWTLTHLAASGVRSSSVWWRWEFWGKWTQIPALLFAGSDTLGRFLSHEEPISLFMK